MRWPKKIMKQLRKDIDKKCSGKHKRLTVAQMANRVKFIWHSSVSEIAKVIDGDHFFLQFKMFFPDEDSKLLVWLTGFVNLLSFSLFNRNAKLHAYCAFRTYSKAHKQLMVFMVHNATKHTHVSTMHILITAKTE